MREMREESIVSKYSEACAERGVKEIAVHVDVELRAMVDAVCKREDVRIGEWIEDIVGKAVNDAKLMREDGSEWTYAGTTRTRKARETIKSLREQLADMQAMIAALAAAQAATQTQHATVEDDEEQAA